MLAPIRDKSPVSSLGSRSATAAHRTAPGGGDLASEVLAWLERFAAAVRAVDLAAGRALFAPEVVAFGTIGVMLVGREELVERQWRQIWPVTSGFRYALDRLHCGFSGELAWVAVPWASQGSRDGVPFERRGRASFVLRHERDGWLAIHSHHSLDPPAAGTS
jgi:ketosteroid isomerase-like protein